MTDEINLETYLRISSNKYGIYLIDKNNFQKLYQNEIYVTHESINYDSVKQFLDNNIFKVEKLIGKFIKNIFLITDSNLTLDIKIGLKQKNFDNIINSRTLGNILTETKDSFKKNYQDQKIMHMIVNPDFKDDKNLDFLENVSKTKDLYLVVNFLSISTDFSEEIEKILEKYQIKVNRYLSEDYIIDFFRGQEIEFPAMICKIINGLNHNEVQVVPKSKQNIGFFEKFFLMFS